ncbi:exodeoxyribonuclease VII small subunit [Alicyclobacillus mali]|uniref:Exodeoxyribonuclease 7 small subunit n=1 Tax=Alicyclobacillus mali (ex Roth et al. 2021) TaxID=1123961 RepID=A0ABS0F5Y7_9BACL|nr:exodeoxyribonuclease VII small subunit [Alicyclobacillus mali (ex Roth et al. 2021)]MBF8378703.1 exodeoxyribonuclease VII small subunit [Alicyclobacillus mali (ex Roth et al. 2021)]MCL6487740.1 exodeoxyribonuclease VII small subunit [Alicyclobacillus mali (ex Roth et al. 2021)]
MEETQAAGRNSSDWTFEQAMRRLEEIVRQLEAGDLPLDASIRAYEESMRLVKFCREQLDKAEFQLEKLGQELADESVSP